MKNNENKLGILRSIDESVLNELKKIVVIDDNGKSKKVPVIWTAKWDELTIPVPSICLTRVAIKTNESTIFGADNKITFGYRTILRSVLEEDMNQMIEQLLLKDMLCFKATANKTETCFDAIHEWLITFDVMI